MVVAEAGTAGEARDAVNRYRPDVMTLDVEMPSMSGIDFLKRLMRHRPMPVVMLSTLTTSGSEAAIEALSLGAVECVAKSCITMKHGSPSQLADTVAMAARARVDMQTNTRDQVCPDRSRRFKKICLLGGSTGAVDAIEQILRQFPVDCPPTVITQHMPEQFLTSFAARLDNLMAPRVSLARSGQRLEVGTILMAPGGARHLSLTANGGLTVRLDEGDVVSGHRPSVDVMFNSAVEFADRIVAGILTGMGKDGAAGLANLRRGGARTLGQSEETCVVFGMPRVAGELGGVEKWTALKDFGQELLTLSESPVGGGPR